MLHICIKYNFATRDNKVQLLACRRQFTMSVIQWSDSVRVQFSAKGGQTNIAHFINKFGCEGKVSDEVTAREIEKLDCFLNPLRELKEEDFLICLFWGWRGEAELYFHV